MMLSNKDLTYDVICERINASKEWAYRDPATGDVCALPTLTPQALSRYRARKYAVENRAAVLSLIECETEEMLDAAAAKPTGVIARYLRKRLSETALAKFDLEFETMDVAGVSRELGRHAAIEQTDRKLDLAEEKLRLDEKRIALQEKAAEIDKDRFQIAANTWQYLLAWFLREEPQLADRLTARSEEFLTALEEQMSL